MMKIVFIADEFELRSPVQQLLDRFLLGYPHGLPDAFKQPAWEVTLVTPAKNSGIERRMKDFGLIWRPEPVGADALVIFARSTDSVPAGRCFVYGPPLKTVPGIAGTAVRGAWLLPSINVYKPPQVTKGLAIVQGPYPLAEVEGLDALLPLIWGSTVPEVRNVIRLGPNNFWSLVKGEFWPLVKSAISRSDSPQGDAVRDGRTQDLVGLGLLETLAESPRGWLIEHDDGFRYAIAVLDGAVADYNIALQTRAGGIVSAQVHRGPPPYEQHYSRLAAMLDRYFRAGVPPWPPEQSTLISELVERFEKG